jgi:hypothetical protein
MEYKVYLGSSDYILMLSPRHGIKLKLGSPGYILILGPRIS